MIIYGKNPVREALKSGFVKKVYFRHSPVLKLPEYVNVDILPSTVFDKRYPKESQGVVAEIDFNYDDIDDCFEDMVFEKNIAVLDQIMDPQNFGAIVRAGHCFGIKYFIVAKHNQAPVTAVTFKASAGSIVYSRIVKVTNIAKTLDLLKDNGYFIFAADINGKKNIDDVYLTERNCIVLGSEERGIRPNVMKRVDVSFKIPMQGNIDSLNVSQSAAITFYHFSKR